MRKRILWIDILRIIGMISVIMIHVIGNTVNTLWLTGSARTIFNIIDKILYFAIPMFVMISGAMFLNRDVTYKKISKYCLKIFIAIILFGATFSFIELFYINKNISLEYIPQIIKKIISGDTWAHMWYLYLIFGLYLITPVLSKINNNLEKKDSIIFLIVMYIFTILLPEIAYFFKINIGFNIPLSSYIFIYFYGNYIINKSVSNKFKKFSYILGVITIIYVIYIAYNETYVLSLTYTSTPIILLSNFVILLLKDREITKNNSVGHLIKSLGICSFGIYILHQIFINIVFKFIKLDFILDYPYIGLFTYTLGILIVTYLIVFILRKIKLVRNYIL